MNLPTLKIGNLTAEYPIIQGAMGVGVSLSNLASSVANSGGVGVIAGVQIGFNESDFKSNNQSANLRALKKHIKKARILSPEGILGVNLMVAMNNYKDMVLTCVNEKVDLIISGAGLPKTLPELIKGSNTKIAPIVSSGKAAQLIMKLWAKKYDYLPDLLIVEGPEAGGHLGFSEEELVKTQKPKLEQLLVDVIEATKPFVERHDKEVPVIAAGGIFDGHDIAKYLKLGASGVQMGTKFVATEECDAHFKFKQTYLNSLKKNIQLVKSPVGLPGRAISNEFLMKLDSGKIPIKHCYKCLRPCKPKEVEYCISDALINSVKGNIKDGLVFAGSNAYRVDKITSVKNLMSQLITEAENSYNEATFSKC